MYRQVIAFLIVVFWGTSLSAQNFDSFKRQQQEAFQQYRKKTQEDFEAYRRKVNEEFAEFLKKPWEREEGEKPIPEPEKVPDIPPVVMPEIDIDIPEDNTIDVTINFPKLNAEPKPIAQVPYKPKPAEKTLSFIFYGTQGSVRFDTNKTAHLRGASESDVSRFWKALSGEAYDNVVADCLSIRKDRDLCDWAYYKMTEKVSETLYSSRNDRVVFHGWLLTQSGYRIKLGRAGDNLYLLVGMTSIIFGKTFWQTEGGYLVLMDDDDLLSLYVMSMDFPGTEPLRMRMKAKNAFETNIAEQRVLASKKYPGAKASVACDLNTIAFLRDVPVTADDGGYLTDFLKYVDMPLSRDASKDMYASLVRQIIVVSELEAVNIILNFVQTAFDYKTDGEVWGEERPFFPEETLYYPYCDCEDRAILFCQLVRDLMNLDVALVYYPGHLAAAVSFTTDVSGDYFVVDGKKYVVCDPTYINAPVGLTMPTMTEARAHVSVL